MGDLTTEGRGADGLGALLRWYQGRQIRSTNATGFCVDTADDGWLWITLDLRQTTLHGETLEPLVEDRGAGVWFQAWSDGERMTVAGTCPGLGAAAAFLSDRYWDPFESDEDHGSSR